MTDVWNIVTIYGPAAEIDRFRQVCLSPAEQVYRPGQRGWDGCACDIFVPKSGAVGDGSEQDVEYGEYVWNFQQFTPSEPIEYRFSFDTDQEFPEGLFEDLADRFPALAFECDCIEALDDFMGYGWFNPPPGGERFEQNYAVPANYWDGGGERKRFDAAEEAHSDRIDKLKEGLRRQAA
jgi:hypothetical protein